MAEARFLMISLRPAGGHAALRRAAARAGGRVLALSPWRIVGRDDAVTRRTLDAALAQPRVFFSSPAAVAAAARLRPLAARPGQQVFGVGEGTRRALAAAGIRDARAPSRMDSEGLLALPEIAALTAGDAFGLVTAPGGRGEIARRLAARGVHVVRADVYMREPTALRASALAALRHALDAPAPPVFLALSSGEALDRVLAGLPEPLRLALRGATVIAASERLAELARTHGFSRVRVAASARPADLVAAVG